ncbi:MAG: hypothetical protein EORIYHIE_002191, partial [Candidatus Fervidibacter sp.]
MRVERSKEVLTLNSQPSTRNPSSSHPPRVGGQSRLLFATRYSLLAAVLPVA